MYTPRGLEHASNIRIIQEFVEKTDAISGELDKHTFEEVQNTWSDLLKNAKRADTKN
jgi:hypothetical protein